MRIGSQVLVTHRQDLRCQHPPKVLLEAIEQRRVSGVSGDDGTDASLMIWQDVELRLERVSANAFVRVLNMVGLAHGDVPQIPVQEDHGPAVGLVAPSNNTLEDARRPAAQMPHGILAWPDQIQRPVDLVRCSQVRPPTSVVVTVDVKALGPVRARRRLGAGLGQWPQHLHQQVRPALGKGRRQDAWSAQGNNPCSVAARTASTTM